MKARFLHEAALTQLQETIPQHLDAYRGGGFGYLADDPSLYFETSIEIDAVAIEKIAVGSDTGEAGNCILMWEALPGISPAVAREERLWVYLTHTLMLSYSRDRWPIPDDDEKAVSHIRRHFFANGSRGLERDNAASRLWWMAHVCKKVKGIDFDDALTTLLHKPDVRANIIERPTTSQSPIILSAIIRELHASLQGDEKLFDRSVFRQFMKGLNLRGGHVLLDVLDDHDIQRLLSTPTTSD